MVVAKTTIWKKLFKNYYYFYITIFLIFKNRAAEFPNTSGEKLKIYYI